MTREIKFRAWDKTDKVMRDVIDLQCMHGACANAVVYCPEKEPSSQQERRWYRDIELIQYTGLRDKNGREIYEGDIVRLYDGGPGIAVEYDDYCGTWEPFEDERNILPDKSEVIGNVHENPELLEAKA